MSFHNSREDVSILFCSKFHNRLFRGEGLEAKLREITEVMLSVFGKRKSSVPYRPIVRVAVVFVLRIDKMTAGYGRGRYVRNIRTNFIFYICDQSLKQLNICGNASVLNIFWPLRNRASFYLVVTAYQGKRCVMSDALEVLSYFYFYILKHSLVGHIKRAGKHHVHKYDKAKLIAYIEEEIVGVISSAPHSYRIEVCILTSLKKSVASLFCNSRENAVLGYVISAHCEKSYSVAFVHKAFAISVLFSDEIELTKSDALFTLITVNPSGKGVKRLLTKSRGPPKLRIFNFAFCISGKGKIIARRTRHGYCDFGGCIGFYRGSYEHFAALVALCNMKLCYHGTVFFNKINRSPNTHIRHIRSPVPSEHTVRLANVSKAGECKWSFIKRKLVMLFLSVFLYAVTDYL